MTEISAPHPLRCSSMTKQGKECKGYAIEGETTCVAHTVGVGDVARQKGILASARVRREKVEQRKEDSEAAKLSLTERIRRDAATRADEVSKALVAAAIADGSSAAMRELLNRVEGKVSDSLNVNAGDPFSMSEADLHRWLTEAESPSEAPSETL